MGEVRGRVADSRVVRRPRRVVRRMRTWGEGEERRRREDGWTVWLEEWVRWWWERGGGERGFSGAGMRVEEDIEVWGDGGGKKFRSGCWGMWVMREEQREGSAVEVEMSWWERAMLWMLVPRWRKGWAVGTMCRSKESREVRRWVAVGEAG